MKMRVFWPLALIGACWGGAAVAQDKAPTSRPALTVSIVQPQSQKLAQVLPAHGSIAAWQEALIGAEASGLKIAQVRAQVGGPIVGIHFTSVNDYLGEYCCEKHSRSRGNTDGNTIPSGWLANTSTRFKCANT